MGVTPLTSQRPRELSYPGLGNTAEHQVSARQCLPCCACCSACAFSKTMIWQAWFWSRPIDKSMLELENYSEPMSPNEKPEEIDRFVANQVQGNYSKRVAGFPKSEEFVSETLAEENVCSTAEFYRQASVGQKLNSLCCSGGFSPGIGINSGGYLPEWFYFSPAVFVNQAKESFWKDTRVHKILFHCSPLLWKIVRKLLGFLGIFILQQLRV